VKVLCLPAEADSGFIITKQLVLDSFKVLSLKIRCIWNPRYSRGRDWEDLSLKGEKCYQDLIPINKLGVMAYTCHPSYTGHISRRIRVEVRPWAKTQDTIKKCLKQKRARGMA
jgi:hypothetical protein